MPKARAKNCTFEKFHSEKFRYLFLNGAVKEFAVGIFPRFYVAMIRIRKRNE